MLNIKVIAPPTPNLRPIDVPVGSVYTYGDERFHYLRVNGGSVALIGDYRFLSPHTHDIHFSANGPVVRIAKDATLTATY